METPEFMTIKDQIQSLSIDPSVSLSSLDAVILWAHISYLNIPTIHSYPNVVQFSLKFILEAINLSRDTYF